MGVLGKTGFSSLCSLEWALPHPSIIEDWRSRGEGEGGAISVLVGELFGILGPSEEGLTRAAGRWVLGDVRVGGREEGEEDEEEAEEEEEEVLEEG